jgi:hypothetical protein
MLRRTMIALAAGSGLMLAGTAVSARPSGGIWSDHSPKKGATKSKPADETKENAAAAEPKPGEPAAAANADSDVNAEAAANANASASANVNAPAGTKSQGAANANLGAVATANVNSALAAGAVASSALPGLTTGLTVKTSAGASLGTVSQVVTGEDGSIRLVVVAGADGKTHRLMPNKLSISGGVVTTTETAIGG